MYLDTALKQAIGDNVKELRTSMKLTQKEFADKVQTTRAVITAIELYKGTSLDVLVQIARTFDVDVGDLLNDKESVAQKALLGGIDPEENYDDRFNALPVFLQSFSKAMTVQLSACFGFDTQLDLVRRTEAVMVSRFLSKLDDAVKKGKSVDIVLKEVVAGKY